MTALPAEVRLDRATPDDEVLLDRLYQLYRHDLSEVVGAVLSPEGRFNDRRLRAYLADPDAASYVLREGAVPLGFVLVGGVTTEPRTIGDFFVTRSARRRGLGTAMARAVFERHPGRWTIAFQAENAAGAAMWRAVAARVAIDGVAEESRPVPGKPHVPADRWLAFGVAAAAPDP